MNTKIIDVFPNVIRGILEQAAANGYVELEVPTGLAALRAQQFRQNKRTAMELLKWIIVVPPHILLQRSMVTLSTVSDAGAPRNLSERGTIYQYDRSVIGDGAAGGGLTMQQRDHTIDLTTGGIGQLVATDKLYVQFDTVANAAAEKLYFQLYFRYVSISLQEFSDIKEGQVTYE